MRWLSKPSGRAAAGSPGPAGRPDRRARPGVEELEDRTVPAGVLGNFGSNGLWLFTSFGLTGSWQQLTTATPSEIHLADNGNVVATFTSGPVGLWRWAGAWQQLTTQVPQETQVS